MADPTLFFVAPEAINLRLTWDGETSTYTLSLSVCRRTPLGDVVLDESDRYQFLTAEEAFDVADAALSTLLGHPL